MRSKTRMLALVLAASVAAAACSSGDTGTAEPVEEAVAPATTLAEARPAQEEPAEEVMVEADIVDTAIAAGDFTTLVAAVEAAGLVDTLKGEGPYTVFAPTDDAFAALPEGTLEGLLADIPALTDILLYHVVSGEVLAADVVTLDAATTVQGTDVAISVDADNVKIGDASVVITDIVTSNGVIHVIDNVLIP